jgi:hypothetical protein
MPAAWQAARKAAVQTCETVQKRSLMTVRSMLFLVAATGGR